MAAFNRFNAFTLDLVNGVHDFDAHTFKVMYTNIAPVASNSVKADLTEIAAGGGYTAGGGTTTITTSTNGSGVAKITGTDVTTTATGAVAAFRYAVVYNDTAASKNLIGCWDYNSTVNMVNGDTFTVDFDATNGILTIGA